MINSGNRVLGQGAWNRQFMLRYYRSRCPGIFYPLQNGQLQNVPDNYSFYESAISIIDNSLSSNNVLNAATGVRTVKNFRVNIISRLDDNDALNAENEKRCLWCLYYLPQGVLPFSDQQFVFDNVSYSNYNTFGNRNGDGATSIIPAEQWIIEAGVFNKYDCVDRIIPRQVTLYTGDRIILYLNWGTNVQQQAVLFNAVVSFDVKCN